MKKIKQKNYGDIEIDTNEFDCVILWGEVYTKDPQCIHIHRKNLDKIIKILTDAKEDTDL